MANAQPTQRELVATYFETTVPRWEEFYQKDAESSVFATIYRTRLAVALSLAKSLGLPAGARALDIGCGPGFASVSLAQGGLDVEASDLVEGQLERTRQRALASKVGDRVATSVQDIHQLTYADATFDLVFVVGVIEWLEDPTKALAEIARVLKPGGHAVISVDNKWSLRNVLDPLTTPPLLPFKRWVVALLDKTGVRRKQSSPRDYAYQIAAFDGLTSTAGLAKSQGVTVGFGPFTFIGLELPPHWGLKLNKALQRLADQKLPFLKDAGFVYVTLVQKRTRDAR